MRYGQSSSGRRTSGTCRIDSVRYCSVSGTSTSGATAVVRRVGEQRQHRLRRRGGRPADRAMRRQCIQRLGVADNACAPGAHRLQLIVEGQRCAGREVERPPVQRQTLDLQRAAAVPPARRAFLAVSALRGTGPSKAPSSARLGDAGPSGRAMRGGRPIASASSRNARAGSPACASGWRSRCRRKHVDALASRLASRRADHAR